MQSPVIYIFFNRPEITRRTFEVIRRVRPSRLFLVSDGPRANHPEDAGNISATRRVVEERIDWPCDVRRNYSDANLGCRERIVSGLNWAFSRVTDAIVLEDDCLPDPGFFDFCDELLARYRDDARIMHIGGTNFAAPHMRLKTSYWFNHHAWPWGWATWSRAWRHLDLAMQTWEARQSTFQSSFPSGYGRAFWAAALNTARGHGATVNSWAFPWNFTCRSLGGLAILPAKNLVENLGFGEDATHTRADMERIRLLAEAPGPLVHPREVWVDPYNDELLTRVYAGTPINFPANLKSRMRIWRNRFLAR